MVSIKSNAYKKLLRMRNSLYNYKQVVVLGELKIWQLLISIEELFLDLKEF